jgi:nicotinamide phosphoribosyltransferase
MSAAWEGAGHLVNFWGTDTFPAVEAVMDYYDEEDMPAFSVPATEHSIMTSLHEVGEMDVLEQLLDEYPTGLLSVVIDSYDYRAFIREAARRFKDRILARAGKLVFRPDSGTPSDVTMECFDLLEEGFGSTVNGKGYKTLNPKVGILWGDGIDPTGIRSVLYTLETAGIAADVMVFAMGGGLLQKINRDTQRFAFKSSYQERNGVGYEIFKNPLDASKASKRGKFVLTKDDTGAYRTTNILAEDPEGEDLLQIVFENGEIVREYNFKEVRENAKL